MKKIISFSLWGDNPKYTIGSIRNAELSKEIYPDWVCRFYIGRSTPNNIVDKLKSFDNTEVIIMDVDGDWTGMFWRFYAASDEDVDVVIVRDCDSRVNLREKEAVNEWLESDKGFHIMRDHPYHTTEILGGMWGSKKGVITDIKKEINEYIKGDFWQVDQNFLREKIYPLVKNNSLVHDEYQLYNVDKKPFPSIRKNKEFVGDVFDENDVRHPEYFKLL
jgi:hypothetical protein